MRFGIPRKTCWIRNTIERSIDQHNSIKGLGKLQFLNFHQKTVFSWCSWFLDVFSEFLMAYPWFCVKSRIFLIFLGVFSRIPHGLPLILLQKSYFRVFPDFWRIFPNSSWLFLSLRIFWFRHDLHLAASRIRKLLSCASASFHKDWEDFNLVVLKGSEKPRSAGLQTARQVSNLRDSKDYESF